MDVNKYEISVMHLTKNMVEDVQLFMNEHEIDPEKDITDSINLVMSAHLSSLSMCLRSVTKHSEEHSVAIEHALNNLLDAVANIYGMQDIRKVTKDLSIN